jgi:hypothetical protein
MMMQPTSYLYSDAVHNAAMHVLTDGASPRPKRVEELRELLYSLAPSIPDSWQTSSRPILARRERSIDQILHALSFDVCENVESPRYQVLSSVMMLALTVKQATSGML